MADIASVGIVGSAIMGAGLAEQIVEPSGLLATNTSTLPVVELATATQRPDQVCGIHFFDPASYAPATTLRRNVAAGQLGRKSCAGFCRY